MRVETLTNNNWKLIAAKHYNNYQGFTDDEFEEDLKRLKYIKKIVTRYRTSGELCERLILNHLIVMVNVFGPELTTRLIFLKMPDVLPIMKPFLVLLSILPQVVKAVGTHGFDWSTDEIPLDPVVITALRKIG